MKETPLQHERASYEKVQKPQKTVILSQSGDGIKRCEKLEKATKMAIYNS